MLQGEIFKAAAAAAAKVGGKLFVLVTGGNGKWQKFGAPSF